MTQMSYAYHKKYRYDLAHGVPRMVDTYRARMHIATCLGVGMTMRSIAAEAGTSSQVVYNLQHGQKSCKPFIERRILSVRPGIARTPTKGGSEPFVPKVGAVRRIQALLALGWTHEEQRRRCGVRTNLICSQQGRLVTLTTFEAIERMYVDLSKKAGPSDRTRQRALSSGYYSPIMWDDIDMDEGPDLDDGEADDQVDHVAVQKALDGYVVPLTTAERFEVVARQLNRGGSLKELERNLGIKTDRYLPKRQKVAA